jgi:hypothetical protein
MGRALSTRCCRPRICRGRRTQDVRDTRYRRTDGKSGLIQRSENYSFDDFKNDLIEHGAVIVVKATTFRHYPWSFESGHPIGAEPGNWYTSESVSIESEMIGKEMLAWLKPSEQDFIHRYRDHIWK